MSNHKNLLNDYRDALKKATAVELITEALIPESNWVKGVEGAAVVATGVTEYLLDPLGSITTALAYAGMTAAGCVVVNTAARQLGRDAALELVSRLLRSNKEGGTPLATAVPGNITPEQAVEIEKALKVAIENGDLADWAKDKQ